MKSIRTDSMLARVLLLLFVLLISAPPATIGQGSPAFSLRVEEDSTEADEAGFALIITKLIFSFDRNISRSDIERLSLKVNGIDISKLAAPSAAWTSLDRRTLCLSLTAKSGMPESSADDKGISRFDATLKLKGSPTVWEAGAAYDYLEHKEVPASPKPAEKARPGAARPKTGDIVAGPWLPDTPDDAGLWNKKDTPWRKGDILVSGPSQPANLDAVSAEAVDYSKLSPEKYRFAVATVMESMHLIYGDMSPVEEQRFQAKWAPVMDFPTPAAVKYFNALGPLLTQFIDARSAIVSLGLQFDEAWSQAGVAAGFQDEDAVAEAVAEAQRLQSLMAGQKARMAEVTDRIKALGDPPNPFAARHRARKALDQALESLPKPKPADGPGSYTLVAVRANVHPKPPRMHDADGEMEPTKVEYAGSTIIKRTTYRDIGDDYKFGTMGQAGFKISWNPPPPKIRADERLEIKTRMEVLEGKCYPDKNPRWGHLSFPILDIYHIFLKANQANRLEEILKSEDSINGLGIWKSEMWPIGGTMSLLNDRDAGFRVCDPGTWKPFLRDYEHQTQKLTTDISWPEIGYIVLSVSVHDSQFLGRVHYVYQLDPDGTLEPAAQPEAPAIDGRQPESRTPPADAERAWKEEAVTGHAAVIASLEGMVEKWRAELAREKVPERAKSLNQNIFQAVTNIQQEQDAVATLQTGELVRTRSAFDEVSRLKLIESCETDVRKARIWPRAEASVDKLIDLLEPAERPSMRAWVDRQLDAKAKASWDTDKLKAVTQAVLHKVQGRALADEAAAEEQINRYEEIKWGAGIGMMVVAPFATAQAVVGGGSWIATQAPSLIAAGFGVGTGYIEGGASEAVVTGLRFYSGIVDTALSFTEGFSKPEGGGFAGGMKNAMMSLLLRKGTELAAGRIIQNRVTAGGAPARKLTWKEVLEDAEFQQAKKDGESLVENYRRTNDAFESLVSKTKPAAMGRNEYLKANADRLAQTVEGRALTEAMAQVESSYTAKMAINAKKIPEKLKQDYNQSLESFLEKPTIAKTKQLMKEMGWNDFEMSQIRHSANTKKVGRDHDLAVKEEGWRPEKGGEPRTLQEFQRDLESALHKAYRETSGKRSSKMADWKGTTSVDAEAYMDKAVLNITRLREQGINPLPGLNKDLAIQTAGVNVYKVELALAKGTMEGRAEACRTMAKEIDTKILPFTPKGSPAARYFENLQAALQRGGENPRQGMMEVYGITGRRLNELAYVLRDRLAHVIQTGNR